MKPLIQFKGIVKHIGDYKVIRGLDLTLSNGDLFGLIGPSGAGKTTLLRILTGFYNADKGSILFHGDDISHNTKRVRDIVGFCTQENSFYHELTIKENLLYYGRMYGISRKVLRKRITHLASLVGLSDHMNTLAGRISGGMKRRLDFAIALIHDPPILILDEPTTGLDPIIRAKIWNLIESINKEGKTIIVTSHLLNFIEKHCKTIGVLHKGKIVSSDTPHALRKKHPKARTFTDVFEKIVQ